MAARSEKIQPADDDLSHTDSLDPDAELDGESNWQNPAEAERDIEEIDKKVLRTIVLFRSQMHMLPLQQQLIAIRNEDGNARFAPGELTSFRYLPEIAFQLAIETVLQSDEVRTRIEADSVNLQIGYDAMYYLARELLGRTDEWTLSETETLAAFHRYLIERSQSPEPTRAAVQPVANDGAISENAARFWLRHVQKVAGFLERPDTMWDDWESNRNSPRRTSPEWQRYLQQREEIFLFLVNIPPLITSTGVQQYTWRIDEDFLPPTGGMVLGEGVVDKFEPFEQIQVIESLAAFLESIAGSGITLSTLARQRLLPVIPGWQEVERAIERIKKSGPSPGSDPQARTDRENLRQFAANLKNRSNVFAWSLISAAVLGEFSTTASPDRRLTKGLDTISSQFSLRARRAQSVDRELLTTLRNLFAFLEVEPPPYRFPMLAPRPQGQWLKRTKAQIERVRSAVKVDEKQVQVAVQTAWNQWYSRFWNDTWDEETLFLPVPEELVAAAAGRGPSLFLDNDRNAMTLRNWSEAFLGSVADLAADDSDQCPFWLAVPALRELGFSRTVLEKILAQIQKPAALGYTKRDLEDANQINLKTFDPNLWASLADEEVPAALIVGPSLFRNWKRAKGCAALILKGDEVIALRQFWKGAGSLLDDFAFRYIVFSEPIEDVEQANEIVKIFDGPSGTPQPSPRPQIALVTRKATSEPISDMLADREYSEIVAPKNLEDLFARLQEIPPEKSGPATR
jgi:hypothetical protein